MEAVPKLPLISFELKASAENTHFGPKLKQYIAEAYREDPDGYGNEVHQLEGLRSTAVRPTIDASGISTLTRYFCQLRAIQSRFPMAKGQPAACSFAWKDLYANMTCTLPDIRFEMACILYNIGALHTQLGASEPRTSADSMKAACTHYQHAAWAFMNLREQYTQPPGVDVSVEIMRLLQEVCFAQAQECILEKSIQDTRKPSVIGAVATQVQMFYKNSLALLGPSTGTDNIHEIIGTKLYNYWYRYLSFKLSFVGCIVCLYQGMHAEEQQKMGERVAFYQLAVDKLAEARKLAKYIEPVQVTQEALTFTNDVVEGKRKAAKNENEFIYHEEVPEKDLLTDLKPVCLVKALPINFNDPEVSGPDIFSRLVPMGAHEASSVYSEEKAKLLRHVVAQADSKTTELTEFMSSLQLDQLEVIDSEQKIPQEIVDRCAAMNAKTEVIQALVDSMNNLAEIIGDVEHSLDDIKNIIQEETQKEKDFQKVMGPRPPSNVQTELSREFHKYQEAHTRTHESNQVLHKAMTLHIANLRLLAQPLDTLETKIPSIDNIEGLDRETMLEMRRVVGKARMMQAQRNTLIQQLRDDLTADDVTSVLLARPTEPTEAIFKEQLEKHTPKVKIIEQNLAAQENIINKLTSLYAAYGESRRMLSDVLRKREGIINALITSYDTYEELLGKSQKGLEFYKKLSVNVNQLLTRLRSTCQVQEEERAQLLAKQSNKGGHTSEPAPSVPAALAPRALSDVTSRARSSATPPPSAAGALKLKDYLPYMKSRGTRSVTPQAQMDPVPAESYYPESIYPTSVRPAPLGSEDLTQMKLPDGVALPQNQSPYRYPPNYNQYETDTYPNSTYSYPPKGFDNPEEKTNYNYSAYTPAQYSLPGADSQYSDPYYSGPQMPQNNTTVTDSQIPYNTANTSQYNAYEPYAMNQHPTGTTPESAHKYNQQDINVKFGQMQIAPKSEPGVSYNVDPYYQYPQTSTPMANTSTYPNAQPNSTTSIATSQVSSEYYPAVSVPTQYNVIPTSAYPGVNTSYAEPGTAGLPYSVPDQQYSYQGVYNVGSQGYTIYTNADSVITSTTSVADAPQVTSASLPSPYDFEHDPKYNPAVLSQLDAMDQPIKSHVTGEALNTNYPTYQHYDHSINLPKQEQISGYNTPVSNYQSNFQQPGQMTSQMLPNQVPASQMPTNQISNQMPPSQTPTEQLQIQMPTNQVINQMPTEHLQSQMPPNQVTNQMPGQNFQVNYALHNQNSTGYAHSYQNHPGYTYNSATGNYEYNYGSQTSYNSYASDQASLNLQNAGQEQNWAPHGVYTSAGTHETVQSPSENTPQPRMPTEQTSNQIYYNNPYGYQTTTNQSSEITPMSTNYGANVNQATYMQSGQQNTSVTFSNNQNQVTMSKENLEQPNFEQNTSQNAGDMNTDSVTPTPEIKEEIRPVEVESKAEPTAFDLLSDIDFSVEHTPLMPEIKVPQVSESAIKKAPIMPKAEPIIKPVVKEEVIQRPAKRELFADPSLLNKFTEEVKKLQKLVDSLVNKTPSGLTVLDAKWKTFQDVQSKENMTRTRMVAMKHCSGNIVTEVVPYDDSRLTLKSNPHAYINATYYKQLASWCIPLVISKSPAAKEYTIFWRAVLENKINCVVCLLSEIEMQGNFYWPTAIGLSLELEDNVKVTLEEVKCNVHWTERKLIVSNGKTAQNVVHYQINVFPAKIVCSPLVLLADKILSQTYDNRVSNQLSGAWIQCSSGAGRSAVVALLIVTMCQVRAGQMDLTDMLDAACANLCKHRTNVLEDTKYLADAYRTALFYVQGVLCSGTTMFNGEAVSVPTGASVLPPVAPPAPPAPSTNQKLQKFSRESFEEMKHSPGLKSGDMKDPLNFLDPLWSLKKK